jgi:hypothetical protein
MKFLKKVINFLFNSNRRRLSKLLIYLLEEEKVYTYPGFSLEFLEEKTGADQRLINQILLENYKLSFYPLNRSLKIKCLKELVKKASNEINLNDYTMYCGYPNSDMMLRDLRIETGLDFDEFCRYTQDVHNRADQTLDMH